MTSNEVAQGTLNDFFGIMVSLQRWLREFALQAASLPAFGRRDLR